MAAVWVELDLRDDPETVPPHPFANGGGWLVLLAAIEERRPAWHADALCQEYPAEWWFPGQGEPYAPAREVCSRCLVAAECLDQALEDGVSHGVWAGTSARRRVELRRRRRVQLQRARHDAGRDSPG